MGVGNVNIVGIGATFSRSHFHGRLAEDHIGRQLDVPGRDHHVDRLIPWRSRIVVNFPHDGWRSRVARKRAYWQSGQVEEVDLRRRNARIGGPDATKENINLLLTG